MNRYIILGCFLTCVQLLAGQSAKFSVSVSSDTVLLGNYFELKFTVENAPAEGFEAPDLHEFNLVGGPNTSSSMSIVNGQVSQSATYSYYLEPMDVGVYTIKPAYLTSEEIALETPPIDIIVVPNPDGIIQRPNSPAKRFDPLIIRREPEQEQDTPSKPRRKF
jgi:hypothetical protein